MLKRIKKIVYFVGILLILLFIFNFFLSDILAYLIKRGDSGLEDLSIGKVSINGIISFEVSDICFENPSGFPDGKVLVIKKLKFDVDPYSIFSDKILVYEVVLSGIVLNWLDDGKNVNFYEIIKEIGGKKSLPK